MATTMMFTSFILVITLVISSCRSQSAPYREVLLSQGTVRGFLSDDGLRYSYTGIPYAKTPVGNNRFMAPLPAPNWKGIFFANKTVMCPQISNNAVIGEEDCLVINIFTTAKTQLDQSLPVIVFIHGGSYVVGSGEIINHNMLLDQGVIIVSINYRLGLLGFLCTETTDAPGNAGLKDQVAALKWIQNNIRHFGGNPGAVTLYGFSVGGATVEFFVLSNATKGLFKNVIMESGSSLAPWALSYNDPIYIANQIAATMGEQKSMSIKELVDFYKTAPIPNLLLSTTKYLISLPDPIAIAPCIEKIIDNTAVLTESPLTTLRKGKYKKVPIMIAYMTMDGNIFTNFYNNLGWKEIYKTHSVDLLYHDLVFKSATEKTNFSAQLYNFYGNISSNDYISFVNFESDSLFAYPAIRSTEYHAVNRVPVYLMEFRYHDNSSVLPGAPHGTLNSHVFESALVGSLGNIVAKTSTEIFANFAKTGIPTSTAQVKWPVYNIDNKSYLVFDDELSISQNPIPNRYLFWKLTYRKHFVDIKPPN